MSLSTEIPGFVKTLYQNIFDRDPPDLASIDYWTNHVRFHGISSTISILFSSDEIKNLPPDVIVDKLYSAILGRDGKNYFLRRLTRGDAMQTIVDDFVGSTEYKQKAQTGTVPPRDMSVYPTILLMQMGFPHRSIFTWNPAGGMPHFIKTLYRNILSRDPLPNDHPNIDHWLNRTHFHGIASTISGFFTSDEFKDKDFKFPQEVIVDKLYRSVLGREGGWDWKNYWIDRLRHGDTVQTIVSDCIESEEYKQKTQAGIVPPSGMLVYCLLNSSFYDDLNFYYRPILTWHSAGGTSHFITTLFHNVLSREVQSDDNIDNFINHVRFHVIVATITGVFTSNEFQSKSFPQEVVVDKLYRSILGREGRGVEKNIQLDRLRGGLAIHVIVNDLVGSDEYKQKAQLGAVPSPDMLVYITKIIYLSATDLTSISSQTDIYMESSQQNARLCQNIVSKCFKS